MLGRFRYSLAVLTAIALSTAIMSPPLGAEPAAQPPELTPMDYPLSPSAQSQLPPPQLPEPQQTGTPATPPQVTGPQPSEQPGPPSPLLGKAPPLPLSWPLSRRVHENPGLLQELQKGLNPVTSKPAPPPALRGSEEKPPVGGTWSLAPSAPGFPPLSNPLLLTDGTVIAYEILRRNLVEAHARLHGQLY